jgi:hypothetical protein
MAPSASRGRWRLPGLGAVIVALTLAGVANATMRPRPSAFVGGRATFSDGEQAIASSAKDVASSAWYCAGPLPVGASKQASSIAVANVGGRPVNGRLVVALSDGGQQSMPIVVASHAEAVYGLERTGALSQAAVSVLVDSANVGVEEVIHGPNGPMAAPCSVTTGTSQYVAVGSTKGADNVALAVYDPSATPAVVSVTLATTTGGVAPPPFQGIDLAAGHVVVLDVGHEVPSRLAVAAIVRSSAGPVVAGAVVRAEIGHSLLSALVGASGSVGWRWVLPPAPLGTAARQGFAVLNPTTRPARVALSLTGSSLSEMTEPVPPGAVVQVSPAAIGSLATTSATLSARGAPVVVVQELALSATGPEPPELRHVRRVEEVAGLVAGRRVRRRRVVVATIQVPDLLHRLPSLPTGFSAASGTKGAYRRWLLPAGESDAHVGEIVTVANPGHARVVVELSTLDGAPLAGGGDRCVLGPGQTTNFVVSALPGLHARRAVALLVTATAPVVAGEILYSRGQGHTTPLGLSAAGAIPID